SNRSSPSPAADVFTFSIRLETSWQCGVKSKFEVRIQSALCKSGEASGQRMRPYKWSRSAIAWKLNGSNREPELKAFSMRRVPPQAGAPAFCEERPSQAPHREPSVWRSDDAA